MAEDQTYTHAPITLPTLLREALSTLRELPNELTHARATRLRALLAAQSQSAIDECRQRMTRRRNSADTAFLRWIAEQHLNALDDIPVVLQQAAIALGSETSE